MAKRKRGRTWAWVAIIAMAAFLGPYFFGMWKLKRKADEEMRVKELQERARVLDSAATAPPGMPGPGTPAPPPSLAPVRTKRATPTGPRA